MNLFPPSNLQIIIISQTKAQRIKTPQTNKKNQRKTKSYETENNQAKQRTVKKKRYLKISAEEEKGKRKIGIQL